MSKRNYGGKSKRHAAGALVTRGTAVGITVRDRGATVRGGGK